MSDHEITRIFNNAKLGDKEIIDRLYRYFYHEIFYYVYSRIGNFHDAQEITSEVFLSMIEGMGSFRGESSFKNYLFGIAKNKIKSYIHSKYTDNSYVLESNLSQSIDNIRSDEDVDKTDRKSINSTLRSALQGVLKLLKPRYAQVIRLRYHKMKSVSETAKIMGISPNYVKVLHYRAIRQASKIWNRLKDKLVRNNKISNF